MEHVVVTPKVLGPFMLRFSQYIVEEAIGLQCEASGSPYVRAASSYSGFGDISR